MGRYQGSKTEAVFFWLSCRAINTSIKCLFLTTYSYLLVTQEDILCNRHYTGAVIRNVWLSFELLHSADLLLIPDHKDCA